MDKYYTPKREEFFHGFICEYKRDYEDDSEWKELEYDATLHILYKKDSKVNSYICSHCDYETFEDDIPIYQILAFLYKGEEYLYKHLGISIRVKYLDKSDIESLGFKFVCYSGCKTQQQDSDGEFKMMPYSILTKEGVYSDNHITCMFLQDGSIPYQELDLHIGDTKGESPLDCYREGGVEGNIVRSIYIKNKSELVKLLKQLNIE